MTFGDHHFQCWGQAEYRMDRRALRAHHGSRMFSSQRCILCNVADFHKRVAAKPIQSARRTA